MTTDQRQATFFLAATAGACLLLVCLFHIRPSLPLEQLPDQPATRKFPDRERRQKPVPPSQGIPAQATGHPRPSLHPIYPEEAPITPRVAITVQGANQYQTLLQTLADLKVTPQRLIPQLNTLVLPNDYHLFARLRRDFPELLWENDAAIGHPPPPDLTSLTVGIPFQNHLLSWLGIDPQTPGRGKNVTIAILDQPLYPTFSTVDADITQLDPFQLASYPNDGHGNAIASLLVAQSPRLQGIVPEASLLSIPVLDSQGTGSVFTLAEAIILATDRGADIISLSLGTHANSTVLQQAVNYAADHGTVIVAAAGNDAKETQVYPAACQQVIAVAACDAASNITPFSNRGSHLDIAAPGLEITADFGPSSQAPEQPQLGYFSGTSAATPCVSAVIAGLLADNPELTPREAAHILRESSSDNGLPGKDSQYGQGVLNALHARHWNDETFTDAAAAGHFLDLDHATRTSTPLIVSAQNSGNTTLPIMTLTLSVNGNEQHKSFFDVPPGQTVSLTVDIPNDQREHIHISSHVTTDSAESALGNNSKTSRISVRPAISHP